VRPRTRAISTGVGLMTASALLVHLSGGTTEVHFHFFVMLGVISLYQDWRPFLVSIAYVALHHGAVGVISPEDVFDHEEAWTAPLEWAGVHAFFVLAMSAVSVFSWRLIEDSNRLARVELEKSKVLVVRLPCEVEEVAGDRHRPDQRVDRDVDQHAQLHDPGHAELPRLQQHANREERRDEVAKAGEEAENRIEPDAVGRAGHEEGVIEQVGDLAQAGEPLLLGGRQGAEAGEATFAHAKSPNYLLPTPKKHVAAASAHLGVGSWKLEVNAPGPTAAAPTRR
jgi:hypothetical protein